MIRELLLRYVESRKDNSVDWINEKQELHQYKSQLW